MQILDEEEVVKVWHWLLHFFAFTLVCTQAKLSETEHKELLS